VETSCENMPRSLKGQFSRRGLYIHDTSITLENCIELHNNISIDSSGGYYQVFFRSAYNIKLKLTYNFCYTMKSLPSLAKPVECPYSMSKLSINPRNFMFLKNGKEIFLSPTLEQYYKLVEMNHPAVTDSSDYDYYHANDYSYHSLEL